MGSEDYHFSGPPWDFQLKEESGVNKMRDFGSRFMEEEVRGWKTRVVNYGPGSEELKSRRVVGFSRVCTPTAFNPTQIP